MPARRTLWKKQRHLGGAGLEDSCWQVPQQSQGQQGGDHTTPHTENCLQSGKKANYF